MDAFKMFRHTKKHFQLEKMESRPPMGELPPYQRQRETDTDDTEGCRMDELQEGYDSIKYIMQMDSDEMARFEKNLVTDGHGMSHFRFSFFSEFF